MARAKKSDETAAPKVQKKTKERSKVSKKAIIEIIDRHAPIGESLLSIFQQMQEAFMYLPEEGLKAIAEKLQLPLTRVYSVATFYNAFSLTPKGKYVIQVCMGTACHVRGAMNITDEMERLLGIKRGETSQDGQFTLETVNCIGACALGPVMVLNGEYKGHLTRDKLGKILDNFRQNET